MGSRRVQRCLWRRSPGREPSSTECKPEDRANLAWTPQKAEVERKKREQDASDAQFGFYGQRPKKGQPCFESS